MKEQANKSPLLVLPDPPASEIGAVTAWEEAVVMSTYLPADPDPNPLFLEKRVYQGSSGKVYPLPVIDRVATEPAEHAWKAVHLENEYLRVMILPEIGGRIHVGYDKRNGYDFFYRQNVIKPALVGLAGPWISGGVEFNWPQHHRPATFMPVEISIEREKDGSVTVWCSDHDPLLRMKGTHGVCLRPGCAFVELKARLYNRTWDTQTFLWWANAATRVHEHYQSFFPKDVRYVADHAKRAVTEFPLSAGSYYGIPYGERALEGVPEEERPKQFVPNGSYPVNDLSWYANIPVPTSYMIVNSRGDFFGGYDHAARAGVVHVADHHVAPGKKQWTWGNHAFGYAWDRSLTENDGPYIELMAGVYTDNQPDFSYLAPGETKSFSQFWYPIREIGLPDAANLHAALRVVEETGRLSVLVAVTHTVTKAQLRIISCGVAVVAWSGELMPERSEVISAAVADAANEWVLQLESEGEILLRHAPGEIGPAVTPVAATEPPPPEEIDSNDELYITGLHLEQYRHATRSPEIYWREGLRRDPGDSRINTALGRLHLRRGEMAEAEQHFRKAIGRLTLRNPNPYESECFYGLGMTRLFEDHLRDAYDSFYKATWSAAWRGPAYHRLAEIDLRRGDLAAALDHISRSLLAEGENLNARALKTVVLRRLGLVGKADEELRAALALDPLHHWSKFLSDGVGPVDGDDCMDLAFDLIRAGLLDETDRVLQHAAGAMQLYTRAYALNLLGKTEAAAACTEAAARASAVYVFPSLLEEMKVLRWAIALNPSDARAQYYLGNFLYDRRRHHEAIDAWEAAVGLDATLPTAWRNLGIAYFNVKRDASKARAAFLAARQADQADARILYEYDQLRKRLGDEPGERLASLELNERLIGVRDDLSVELAAIYNHVGRPADALKTLLSRLFEPWEGGEGLVLGEYVRAQLLLGRGALAEGDLAAASEHFEAADAPPESLNEARHLLANSSNIKFWLGEAWARKGDLEKANHHWERAVRQRGDFQQMQIKPVSEMTYWSALALRRLGHEEEAMAMFRQIYDYAEELACDLPKIDYFATSLPAMLLFEEDLESRRDVTVAFLKAQALLGLGRQEEANAALELVRRLDRTHAGARDLCADGLTLEAGS